jgi:type I restriction enzyme S subunit
VSPIKAGLPRNVEAEDGWRWRALRDCAQLESGHTPSRRRPEWWGGTVPWLALPDIRKLHGKYAYETSEYTNDEGLANSSARILPVGTVCLSRTASIGFVTLLGKPMATSQDFCNWICDRSKLNDEYLMYAFMASQAYLRELGSGSVHKTIYMPTIESFHVYTPDSVDEQRDIAASLGGRLKMADDLANKIKAQLADADRLPERLLAAAFRCQ